MVPWHSRSMPASQQMGQRHGNTRPANLAFNFLLAFKMAILPLKLPRIRCASFMSTKRVSLPQSDVSGESWLMLIGRKAIQNACCNDQTAYNGADVLNPYFNPSAQGTGETLVGLIGEPGAASSFPISEPQLRSNIGSATRIRITIP